MMRFTAGLAVLAGLGLAMVAGCGGGGGASEDKPVAEVQAEAAKMNPDQLKSAMASYQAAIDKRQAEIKGLTADLQKVPLADMMGEKAKDLRAKMEQVTQSITKLQERMQVYAAELLKRTEAGESKGR
jgi:chromosome condensin MukBEF ATPase and DNA-binding subunit MukB